MFRRSFGMASAIMAAIVASARFDHAKSVPLWSHLFSHSHGSSKRRNKTTRHQHSSARQRARYARQLAAGQLRIVAVAAPVAVEPVKKTRAKKVAANV